eukprot:TRINITY_DN69126_c0_g1_i1.p1 TRINITY_DN69126_c0_g1~~TRINITY_DN69126_c0_g1_i1.p1  ORF type:complete len:458 (+),score=122.28 TRINITY_DN69126_c0_g1_i1:52-1425(+)
MGAQQSVVDEDKTESTSLKRTLVTVAVLKEKRGEKTPGNIDEFESLLGFYPAGLKAMFQQYPGSDDNFFSAVLPFIIDSAAKLKTLLGEKDDLKRLVQGKTDSLIMPRELVLSLLANMFLCTPMKEKRSKAMPHASFEILLTLDDNAKQEIAKLRMFVHYFERAMKSPPKGELRIYRMVRDSLDKKEQARAWEASEKPLLELDMAEMNVGFEDEKGLGCLHADFANMFLGGGVITGGCVQEEIRFATCPELCAAMLVCPCMLENEAITIIGGEQFCKYEGYARSLRFGGDHEDANARAEDGTVLVAITAMDAFDFRGEEDRSVKTQLGETLLLRELEKAAAAFAPVDEEQLKQWNIIATGNWGCGAFGGSIPVKALVQWLAASEGGRRLCYFPFDSQVGPELQELSKALVGAKATVGQVFTALRSEPGPREEREVFPFLKSKLLGGAGGPGAGYGET